VQQPDIKRNIAQTMQTGARQRRERAPVARHSKRDIGQMSGSDVPF
jgi:hypothetical protein